MRPLQERWSELTPQSRKTLVSVGVLGALLVLLYLFVAAGPESEPRAERGNDIDKNLLTGSDPKAFGLDALGAGIRDNREGVRGLAAKVEDLETRQARSAQQLADQLRQLRALMEGIRHDADAKIGTVAQRQRAALSSLEREVSRTGRGASGAVVDGQGPEKPGTIPSTEAQEAGLFDDAPLRTPEQGPGAGRATAADASLIKVRVFGEQENVRPADDEDAAEGEVYLPAGSILSGVLITGVDAPTGLQSKRDPMPALVRIKHQAILPNRYRMDVKECFLVVATTGDLSTERAFMRGESFSCVRNDGGVIEVMVDSYAVGEDGKAGMRGRLVSRNGSLVAKAAAAGFLEGLSNIFRPVGIQGLQTDPGSETLFQRPDAGDALEAAGYSGFSSAMRRLADYYVDLADQIVPFVEVDAGRKIESVLLKGVSLQIHST